MAVDVTTVPEAPEPQMDPNNPGAFLNPTATPQPTTSRKVYTFLHSERPDDPNWENPVIAWAIAHGYSYPPAGSRPAPTDNTEPTPTSGNPAGNPPVVRIISPADNSQINSVPFMLQANAIPDQGNSITRVDLLIDGAFVQSLSSAPYNFTINNQLNGQHTFAIHAVDNQNNSADTSINLKFK
jgi:hypothetical protein